MCKITGRIPKLQKVMKGHQGKCTKFKVTAEITAKQVNRDKPTLLKDWAREKKKYRREYNKKSRQYRRAEERIKREERIRFREWDSTQEIKCMLRSYEKCKHGSSDCSGQLNRASMKRCTNKVKTQPKRKSLTIHYPKLADELRWRLRDFAGLVDTSGFSKHCSRTEKADELADAPKRCRKGKNFHKQKPKPVCRVGGKKVKVPSEAPKKGEDGGECKISAAELGSGDGGKVYQAEGGGAPGDKLRYMYTIKLSNRNGFMEQKCLKDGRTYRLGRISQYNGADGVFKNGSSRFCPGGKNREAKLILQCDKSDSAKDGRVVSVTEPKTCSYEVKFGLQSCCRS